MNNLNGPEVMQAEMGPQPKQWKQPRNEMLREWEINIKFFNVGCVVSVGCQSFAFESVDKMMTELKFYVENPDEARVKWNKIREEQK
jgi:hypothetical protein